MKFYKNFNQSLIKKLEIFKKSFENNTKNAVEILENSKEEQERFGVFFQLVFNKNVKDFQFFHTVFFFIFLPSKDASFSRCSFEKDVIFVVFRLNHCFAFLSLLSLLFFFKCK